MLETRKIRKNENLVNRKMGKVNQQTGISKFWKSAYDDMVARFANEGNEKSFLALSGQECRFIFFSYRDPATADNSEGSLPFFRVSFFLFPPLQP